ncbi:MAG: enoyl-CoA hydratase-related protein [Pseudomonadota bacterium]
MPIELDIQGHAALITLNRPDKRNVLDLQASRALADAVDAALGAAAVRAVIVDSRGKAFCAGGSLDELLKAREEPELLQQIYAGFLAVLRCPLPTLALVQGLALGAGLNLALACDMRVVAPQARFDTRFMQLGIHCGGGHSWLLQRALGYEAASAALLLGQTFDGEEAVIRGLALECVATEQLQARARALTEDLATVPRELLEASKASLLEAADGASHEAMLSREFERQTASLRHPHAKRRLAEIRQLISSR